MSLVRCPTVSDRRAYLASDQVVDSEAPEVQAMAHMLAGRNDLETARSCFVFVRDEVEHSYDFRRSPTTCSASEVLAARTGYCYAKSHLLVALLRANGLRAGFCYQRLTVDGPKPPFCLHGLVAVDLPDSGWFAIDARGNRKDVEAVFEPPNERLAFELAHDGERDFAPIYPRPLQSVVDCLRAHATWDAVLKNLPDAESLTADSAMVRSGARECASTLGAAHARGR